MSPFDAQQQVTFDPDLKGARVNRFGIGFGQKRFWGNVHFPDSEGLESIFERKLVDLRRIYGTPAKGWTGQFLEEESVSLPPLLRRVRFIPLLKSGKRGKTVHTVQSYSIKVTPERIKELSDSLRIPVR